MNERGIAPLIIILIVIGAVAVGTIGYAVMSGMVGSQGLGKDVLFKKMLYKSQQQGTGGTLVMDKAGMETTIILADEIVTSFPMTSDEEAVYETIKENMNKISLFGIMGDDSTGGNIYAIYAYAQSPQSLVNSLNEYITDFSTATGDSPTAIVIRNSGKIGSFDYAILENPDAIPENLGSGSDYTGDYVSLATRGNEVLVSFPDDEQATKLNKLITLVDSGPLETPDSEIEAEISKAQMLFYGKSTTDYSGINEAYAFLSQAGEDNYSISAYAEMDALECADAQTSLIELKGQMGTDSSVVPAEMEDLINKMEINCGGKFSTVKLNNFSLTGAIDSAMAMAMSAFGTGFTPSMPSFT